MPLKIEAIIPPGSTNIYGDQPSEDVTTTLGARLPYLPVCHFTDLRNMALYSESPLLYEQENIALHPEMGDAYAWRRLPRFIDRFKEVREKMRSTFPNELVLSLDVGSSTPIYSEMMRAHWLRKCGDHAHQAFGYAMSMVEDKSRLTNILLGYHARKDAQFKASFISCLQIALYCVPYEISGDESAIREYLEESLRLFLSGTKRFIDKKDRKSLHNLGLMYEQLGLPLDSDRILRVPLERAWRIDAVLGPPQGLSALEQISHTGYPEALSPEQQSRAKSLAADASKARKDKNHSLETKLRTELSDLLGSRRTDVVGDEHAVVFLDYLVDSAIEFVLQNGYAPPVRFMSLDLRDPLDLAQEAQISLDAETKMSGFYRRTIERLNSGDPDHIHDTISNVGVYILGQTATSITSIESYPFYAEQPDAIRHVDARAEQIAQDMLDLCATLKKQGEYMTFPWGTSAFSNQQDGLPAKLAREKLPDEVLKKIIKANLEGEFLISVELYSPEEVRRWMSQGEFDTLLGLSPAIDMSSDSLIKVLRIKRAKKAAPSGKLLGAKQIR